MKNFAPLALILLMASAFSACTKKQDEATQSTPTPSAQSILIQKNLFKNVDANETPFRVFQLLSENPNNVNFSPLSFNMAFAQVYLSSKGATKDLYQQIFGFNDGGFSFNSEFELSRSLKKELHPKLYFANAAWVRGDKLKNVLSTYKQDLSKYLDGNVQKLDVKALNAWVAQATNDKIQNLLDKLDASTITIFVNALYLKADWKSPFKAEDTYIDTFRSSPHLVVKPEMMHQTGEFQYGETRNALWLSMPYANSPLEMVIGLPKKEEGIGALEKDLDSKVFAQALKAMKTETVRVSFPKFKFDTKISLLNTLVNAGYGDLFKTGDYTLFNTVDKPLTISDVIQATAIVVDEKGTEAAAATAVVMEKGSTMGFGAKEFTANHPFLFFIRNSKSGEIYFMGRVLNPLEAH